MWEGAGEQLSEIQLEGEKQKQDKPKWRERALNWMNFILKKEPYYVAYHFIIGLYYTIRWKLAGSLKKSLLWT